MRRLALVFGGIIAVAALASGCTGFKSFSSAARGGDTVSLTLGWNPELTRDQLTVTVSPNGGAPVVYPPGDPAVRALVNLYPDPLSRLIVERESGSFSDDGYFYSVLMENEVTGPDKDFSQKLLILDLPTQDGVGNPIQPGPAEISFASTGGETLLPVTVDILPGTGERHLFRVQEGLTPTLADQIDLAERAPHYAVSFSGATLPHAIQVDLTREPGVGTPYVVSPRGTDLMSVMWNDVDGSTLRVILLPVNQALSDFVNFKFFVAGGVQNLQAPVGSVKAFDIDGNELDGPDAVSATIVSSL
jgi:hypothetical protein